MFGPGIRIAWSFFGFLLNFCVAENGSCGEIRVALWTFLMSAVFAIFECLQADSWSSIQPLTACKTLGDFELFQVRRLMFSRANASRIIYDGMHAIHMVSSKSIVVPLRRRTLKFAYVRLSFPFVFCFCVFSSEVGALGPELAAEAELACYPFTGVVVEKSAPGIRNDDCRKQ